MIFVPTTRLDASGALPPFAAPTAQQATFEGTRDIQRIGRGLVALGGAASKIASGIQNNIDAADALEGDSAMFESAQTILNSPDDGYLSTTLGKNAVDGREGVLDKLRKERERIGRGMRTSTSRSMFNRSSAGYSRDAARAVDRHAARESRSYLAGQLVAADANRRVEWVQIHEMPEEGPQFIPELDAAEASTTDTSENAGPQEGAQDATSPAGGAEFVEDAIAESNAEAPDAQGPAPDAQGPARVPDQGPTRNERIHEVHALVVGSLLEQSSLRGESDAEAELTMRNGLAELHNGQLNVLRLKGDTAGTRAYVKRWKDEIPVSMREDYLSRADRTAVGARAAAQVNDTRDRARTYAILSMRRHRSNGLNADQAKAAAMNGLENAYISRANLNGGPPMTGEFYDMAQKFLVREAQDEALEDSNEQAAMLFAAEGSLRASGMRPDDWAATDIGRTLVGKMMETTLGQDARTKLFEDRGAAMAEADYALVMEAHDTRPEQLRDAPNDGFAGLLVGQPDGRRNAMIAARESAQGKGSGMMEGRAMIVAKLKAGGVGGRYNWAFVTDEEGFPDQFGKLNEFVIEAMLEDLLAQPDMGGPMEQKKYINETLDPNQMILIHATSGELAPRSVAGVVGYSFGRVERHVGEQRITQQDISFDVRAKIIEVELVEDPETLRQIPMQDYRAKYGTLTEEHQRLITTRFATMNRPGTPQLAQNWYDKTPAAEADTQARSILTKDQRLPMLAPELQAYIAAQAQQHPDAGAFVPSPIEEQILRHKAVLIEERNVRELRIDTPQGDDPAWIARIDRRTLILKRSLNEWVQTPTLRERRLEEALNLMGPITPWLQGLRQYPDHQGFDGR